ncbi:neprilysin-4-like [Ornithodoros turicata]|uniref:neprilysin-4-like n=1 Tax=Ornithodoros turicata TaxID=34597 RepID=UPI003139E96A
MNKNDLYHLYIDCSMETLVEELRRTFRSLIESKAWIDQTTKTEALKKIDGLGSKIGYADRLMNDSYLEGKYKYVKKFSQNTPYVKIIANLLGNNAMQALEQLETYYNKSVEWYTGPAVVNAFYAPGSNDISFPAGILQPPFYEYGLPLSVNMGAIGMVIGHEVTHAFDDTGSQFDSDGKLHNWWTAETRKAFKEGAQCFIKQYGSIKDSQTSLMLNGVNTQGENIADNGGLFGAFHTYRTLLEEKQAYKDLALPGLENVTSDQMFFIANAMVWCQNTRERQLRHLIQYDVHAPAKYRIIVPMSNMPEFSEAFNCSASKPMNATRKCRVW